MYFMISYVYKVLKINNLESALLVKRGLLLINLKHIIGISLFGVISYVLIPQYRFLINTLEILKLNTLLLFLTAVYFSAIFAFKSVKKNFKVKNEMSQHTFNLGLVYFIIRIVFLLTY